MEKVINIIMRVFALTLVSLTCIAITNESNSMTVKSIGLVVYFLLIDSILHFKVGTSPWK